MRTNSTQQGRAASLLLWLGFSGFLASSPVFRGVLSDVSAYALVSVAMASTISIIVGLSVLAFSDAGVGFGVRPSLRDGASAAVAAVLFFMGSFLVPVAWVQLLTLWAGVYLSFVAVSSCCRFASSKFLDTRAERVRTRRNDFLTKVEALTTEKVSSSVQRVSSMEKELEGLLCSLHGVTQHSSLFIPGNESLKSVKEDLTEAKKRVSDVSSVQMAESVSRFVADLEFNFKNLLDSTTFPKGLGSKQKDLVKDIRSACPELEQSSSSRMAVARKLGKLSSTMDLPDRFTTNSGSTILTSWSKQGKLEIFGN